MGIEDGPPLPLGELLRATPVVLFALREAGAGGPVSIAWMGGDSAAQVGDAFVAKSSGLELLESTLEQVLRPRTSGGIV